MDWFKSYSKPDPSDAWDKLKDAGEYWECFDDAQGDFYRELLNYDAALCQCVNGCGCCC
jgi:hypothetical protein